MNNTKERALVVLTPSESKRLIARAVCRIEAVKKAYKSGRIVIIGGTTNAFVVEELTGRAPHRFWFAAGRIAQGELGANDASRREPPVLLEEGREVAGTPNDLLARFTAEDIYIKGANAVDCEGRAGVMMADPKGGTIGAAIGILQARGSRLIVPVGLEKLVPSVIKGAASCGQGRLLRTMGLPVGMMPLVNALVVTEIEAVALLFEKEVEAVHVASGGVEGCEGAVTLALEGSKEGVIRAFDYMAQLKGEEPVGSMEP